MTKNNIESKKNLEVKNGQEDTNILIQADVDYSIQVVRWHLKILGLWPNNLSSSNIQKLIASFLMIACLFCLAFVMIPGSLFTFIIVTDPSLRLKLTGVLSFCVMAILKYSSLALERSNVARCISHIIDDWSEVDPVDNRSIMLKYAQFGRFGAGICAVFMYGGALFYAGILPHVSAAPKNENNITIRPLPYPGYYIIFDPQKSPIYEIVFIVHCFCAFVMHSITSTTCSIAVVFVMHACGQLEILISWLKDLVNWSKNRCDVDERFFRIIDKHVRTLKFIGYAECVLREICLVELAGCTLNICFLGYDILFEWSQSDAITIMTYNILLISFTFNIFLFCYIGEFLSDKCQKVGETMYMIDWYTLPKRNILGLSLLMVNAQNPLTITAGRMIDLSINTFGAVIRTSVGYLNLLRTLIS